jgi:hypothetical protein
VLREQTLRQACSFIHARRSWAPEPTPGCPDSCPWGLDRIALIMAASRYTPTISGTRRSDSGGLLDQCEPAWQCLVIHPRSMVFQRQSFSPIWTRAAEAGRPRTRSPRPTCQLAIPRRASRSGTGCRHSDRLWRNRQQDGGSQSPVGASRAKCVQHGLRCGCQQSQAAPTRTWHPATWRQNVIQPRSLIAGPPGTPQGCSTSSARTRA